MKAVYRIGKESEYSAGYVLPGDEPTPAPQEITQTMIDWFNQDKRLAYNRVDRTSTGNAAETVRELTSVVRSLKKNGAKIKEVRVSTTISTTELEQDSNILSATETATLVQQREESEITFEPQNYKTDKPYTPKTGYISTRCCSTDRNGVGRRYVYQSFKWNRWRMGKLKNRSRYPIAFEMDATYPRGGGTYLGSVIGYSSNLPGSYRETEVSDGGNVRSTGVGTTRVDKLKAYKRYWGTVRTWPGKDRRETGGVRAQWGRKSVGCNGSAWCMLRTADTDLILRPDRGYTVPGRKSWRSGP
ncbi:MAG: hypothetical protein WA990_13930 [Rubrobacteraceae bacterium]